MNAEPLPQTAAVPDAAAPVPVPGPAELWVERTGTRTYTGRSSRGAVVQIGPDTVIGAFTPGELLKIALAGCTGMTSDSAFARRLGADFAATVRVAGPKHQDDDLYPELNEELVVDLSALDPAERERLLTVVHRAVEQHCTVARTLTTGATVELTVTGER